MCLLTCMPINNRVWVKHVLIYSTIAWQMIKNLTARKRAGIPALHVRCLRSSPKSIGMHAASDRSLHWLYIIFLDHSKFARSRSIFYGHGSSFPVVSGLGSTSPNAETARKIHI